MSASQSRWPAPELRGMPVEQVDTPAPGATLRVVAGHIDPTVNLHDRIVCIRRGRVEDLWPSTARGAMW